MNKIINKSSFSIKNQSNPILFWIAFVSLIAGGILSILSALHFCSEECVAGHNYRLYGFSFETLGIPFFFSAALLLVLSRFFPLLKGLVIGMLAVSLGAEGMFVYAQKFIIGHWCPICLSIAATIIIAFIAVFIDLVKSGRITQNSIEKGATMKQLAISSSMILMMAFGFFFAQSGFAKFNPLEAQETDMLKEVAFGDLDSIVEVYVFTDWKCPACHKVEPVLLDSAPAISKVAKLIFVDYAVHTASLNFLPYNLAFMVHNKPEYLKLRKGLSEIALSDTVPTENVIEALAKKNNVKYESMSYVDITQTTAYFNELAKRFNIESTPTVIVVNSTTKKGKRLSGILEITKAGILSAIDEVK